MRIYTRENGLEAYIELSGKDLLRKIPREKLAEVLTRLNITHGLLLDDWDERFEQCRKKQMQVHQLLIARGKEPVHGQNGWVEWLVDLKKPFPPPPSHNRQELAEKLVRRVSQGQALARLHPPTPGQPGYTVTGEEIPATPGIAAELPAGNNTQISSDDPELLVATVDGHARFDHKGRVCVEPVEIIEGDVRPGAEGLQTLNTLVILGDVKSGAVIKVVGDLIICGTVEDAELTAGGDVYIAKGFMGKGKGRVRAGSNVYLRHVDHQSVYARKNIFVEEEIIHSRLRAEEKIVLHNQNGSIVGGCVEAGRSLIAGNVGNKLQMRTEISLGEYPSVLQKIASKERELKYIEENLKRIKKGLYHYIRANIGEHTRPPAENKKVADLQRAREKYEALRVRVEQELLQYRTQLYNLRKNARLEVRGRLYPGVVIRFHGNVYQTPFPRENVILTPQFFAR